MKGSKNMQNSVYTIFCIKREEIRVYSYIGIKVIFKGYARKQPKWLPTWNKREVWMGWLRIGLGARHLTVYLLPCFDF